MHRQRRGAGSQPGRILSSLELLRPKLAAAADAVVQSAAQYRGSCPPQDWDHHGGFCDEVATALYDVLNAAGFDATTWFIEADEHAVVLVRDSDGDAIMVDVPYQCYEIHRGAYCYDLIPGARITPDDVVIAALHEPFDDFCVSGRRPGERREQHTPPPRFVVKGPSGRTGTAGNQPPKLQPWEMDLETFIADGIVKRRAMFVRSIEHYTAELAKLGPRAVKKRREFESYVAGAQQLIEQIDAGNVEWLRRELIQKYAATVEQAIKADKPVPPEIITTSPAFIAAKQARERYLKGRHTSFANVSAAIDASMLSERGYKVKRQDGKPIKPEQKAEIARGVDEVEAVLGDLAEHFRVTGITIAHTSGTYPFLRGDAGGLYSPDERTVTMGIASKVTGRGFPALAHELGHWMDYEAGRALGVTSTLRAKGRGKVVRSPAISNWEGEYFAPSGEYDPAGRRLIQRALAMLTSDTRNVARLLAAKKEQLANNPQLEAEAEWAKIKLGAYWRSAIEIWARLVEQFVAHRAGYPEGAVSFSAHYPEQLAYWSREEFAELEPEVERQIRRRLDLILKPTNTTGSRRNARRVQSIAPTGTVLRTLVPDEAAELGRALHRDSWFADGHLGFGMAEGTPGELARVTWTLEDLPVDALVPAVERRALIDWLEEQEAEHGNSFPQYDPETDEPLVVAPFADYGFGLTYAQAPWVIIDGWHRMASAIRGGAERVRAYVGRWPEGEASGTTGAKFVPRPALEHMPSPFTYEDAVKIARPAPVRLDRWTVMERVPGNAIEVRYQGPSGFHAPLVRLYPGGLAEILYATSVRQPRGVHGVTPSAMIIERLKHILGYSIERVPNYINPEPERVDLLMIDLPTGRRQLVTQMLIRQPRQSHRARRQTYPIGAFLESLCPHRPPREGRHASLEHPMATAEQAAQRLLSMPHAQVLVAAGLLAKMAWPPTRYLLEADPSRYLLDEDPERWEWGADIDEIVAAGLAKDEVFLHHVDPQQLPNYEAALIQRQLRDALASNLRIALISLRRLLVGIARPPRWYAADESESAHTHEFLDDRPPLWHPDESRSGQIHDFLDTALWLVENERSVRDYYGFPTDAGVPAHSAHRANWASHFLGLWWDRVRCVLAFRDATDDSSNVSGRRGPL